MWHSYIDSGPVPRQGYTRDEPVTDGCDPSPLEYAFLTMLNQARYDPWGFGWLPGSSRRGTATPLLLDARLMKYAQGRARYMASERRLNHAPGVGSCLLAAGIHWSSWAESLAAGKSTPGDILLYLLSGHGNAGHRKHLLGTHEPYRSHHVVGVGVVENAGTFYVAVDTAALCCYTGNG